MKLKRLPKQNTIRGAQKEKTPEGKKEKKYTVRSMLQDMQKWKSFLSGG